MDHYGKATFSWEELAEVRQKPLEPDIMDNWDDNYFQGHGAHMTLMVFVQGPPRRRSQEGWSRRAERSRKRKADRKGEGTKGNGSQKGYRDPYIEGPSCLTFFDHFLNVGEAALAADLIMAWKTLWGGRTSSRLDHGFQIPPGRLR